MSKFARDSLIAARPAPGEALCTGNRRHFKLVAAGLTVFLLVAAGCGQSGDSNDGAAATARGPAPSATDGSRPGGEGTAAGGDAGEAVNDAATADAPEAQMRRIEVKLYYTGEPIELMVPADVETKGRMIEVRQNPDGTYYFVSLLPE